MFARNVFALALAISCSGLAQDSQPKPAQTVPDKSDDTVKADDALKLKDLPKVDLSRKLREQLSRPKPRPGFVLPDRLDPNTAVVEGNCSIPLTELRPGPTAPMPQLQPGTKGHLRIYRGPAPPCTPPAPNSASRP